MTPDDASAFFEQPWPEGEYRLFQLGFVVDDLLAAATQLGARLRRSAPSTCSPASSVPCTYRGTDIARRHADRGRAGGSGADRADPAALRPPERLPRVRRAARLRRPPALHGDPRLRRRRRRTTRRSGTRSCARSVVGGQHVALLRHLRRLRLLHRGRRGRCRASSTSLGRDRADVRRVGRHRSGPRSSPATATARRRASRSRGGRLHPEQHRGGGLEHAADGVRERGA